MLKHTTHVTTLCLIASLLVLASSHAWAQAEQLNTEPAGTANRWFGLVFAVVFLLALCVGSFMKPKRTHQD